MSEVGQSIKDQLRATAAAEVEDLELDVLPAVYGGLLVATYRAATDGELDALEKLEQTGRRGEVNVSAITDTCTGLWERHEGGKLEPIVGEAGEHARWDQNLAEYLGLEAKTNEQLIRLVFKTPAGLRAHAQQIAVWNSDPGGTRITAALGG